MIDFRSNQEGTPVPLPVQPVNSPFNVRLGPPTTRMRGNSAKQSNNSKMKIKDKKKRRNSKDKGIDANKPRRPLSAYNLFFQQERVILLESLPVRAQGKPKKSHGKLGFVEMARTIGHRWRTIDKSTRAYYDHLARLERDRYEREMETYKKENQAIGRSESRQSSSSTSSPCACSASSSSSSASVDDSTAMLSADDMEPINYEPIAIDLDVHFDQDMIYVLENTFW